MIFLLYYSEICCFCSVNAVIRNTFELSVPIRDTATVTVHLMETWTELGSVFGLAGSSRQCVYPVHSIPLKVNHSSSR